MLTAPTRKARAAIHRQWAARHPVLARAERALRKAQAKAEADWGHKVNGTVQTHAHAARVRQGAMARLFQSGAIDVHQLGAAQEIAAAAAHIGRGLGLRSLSLETRVDGGAQAGDAFFEALGQVRREVAYGRWRAALAHPAGPVLAMVIDDRGVAEVAREWRIHKRRAKKLLLDALDLWPALIRQARDEVDEASLLAAQAGVLS